ncbi:hypothetical protein BZZ01_27685 [Nostocales cyanobacterium HT-58-2]|nr:hypothetical protein BZZ01_27685 [Nostocales cyanobacterium HT-58-2]
MNKVAKALILSLVFAAPVALSAPAVQAKTHSVVKTTTIAAKPVTRVKTTKVRHHKHHGKHKASHSGSPVKK